MANPYYDRNLAVLGGFDLMKNKSYDNFMDAKLGGLLKQMQQTNNFVQENNLMNIGVEERKREEEKLAKKEARMKALREFGERMEILAQKRSGNPQIAAALQQQMDARKLAEQQRIEAAQQEIYKQNVISRMSPSERAIFGEASAFGGDQSAFDAVQNYRKNQSSDSRTVSERSRDRLMELNNNPNRNPEQEYEMNLLKTEVYGKKQVIPFFDSNGNPLPQIITNWDLNDNPELLNNLVEKGFATVGTNPSGAFNAPTTANDEISQKWQDTTNTLDLINQLSVVLDQGRDSPTVAGAIADLVNTGIYQVKAANKLLSFQENYPKKYSETVNYIQNKHGSVLDKISSDRGIATSTVMRLAYALAKQQDPGGRLSDKDVDIAIEVIGGSGANVEKRLSVLGSLYNSLTGEFETYLETQRRKYPGNQSIQGTINRFTDLPTFSYSSAPISVGKYKIEPVN